MAARSDRGGGGRTRRDAGEGGRGRGGSGRKTYARGGRDADGPEGSGRGHRGDAVDGGALPLVRQSPAARRFRRIGRDALAERIDRSRTGRLEGRQSPLAHGHDPIGLVVAAPSTGLGAGALVPRADQGREQAAEEEDGRRAGAQAARRAVEMGRRRRRDRGRRAEGRLGELTTRDERTAFRESAEVRSTSVDPGGRTDGLLGQKSRSEEWTRPPEPTACESGIRVRSLKRDDRM